MVIVKTAAEIKKLREAGRLSALALKVGGEAVVPGVTTAEIDRVIQILSRRTKNNPWQPLRF